MWGETWDSQDQKACKKGAEPCTAPGTAAAGTAKLQVLWEPMPSPPHHHLHMGSCPCASKFALRKLEGTILTAAARGHGADFTRETLKGIKEKVVGPTEKVCPSAAAILRHGQGLRGPTARWAAWQGEQVLPGPTRDPPRPRNAGSDSFDELLRTGEMPGKPPGSALFCC